ncbi:hypothetical protein HMPREF9711_03115 [Myroides odoratimimus CCUG 3837]|uniref:hypothetical protein n=1 Tax=Myroides odoratimimus TaxID=76832 RepID=UPI000280AC41|nr:hypothetical protein [Myroides odoratimimus]EKB02653.1 hypothetical protein HMPREF9711_03115 [Myroides odoratimimus CCUG 3837]
MKNIIQALKESIDKESWYSSLFILVTIPDICSKSEFPSLSTNKRYPKWINDYLHKVDTAYSKYICGYDFYALRCSLLHEGHSDIEGQKAFRRIQHIRFLEKGSHLISISNSYVGSDLDGKNILTLSVKDLAIDMLEAYQLWFNSIKEDKTILERLEFGVEIKKELMIGGIYIS